MSNSNKNRKEFFKSENSQPSLTKEEINKKIEEKAYEIYLQRGCTPGNEEADWLEAEKEVMENL